MGMLEQSQRQKRLLCLLSTNKRTVGMRSRVVRSKCRNHEKSAQVTQRERAFLYAGGANWEHENRKLLQEGKWCRRAEWFSMHNHITILIFCDSWMVHTEGRKGECNCWSTCSIHRSSSQVSKLTANPIGELPINCTKEKSGAFWRVNRKTWMGGLREGKGEWIEWSRLFEESEGDKKNEPPPPKDACVNCVEKTSEERQ